MKIKDILSQKAEYAIIYGAKIQNQTIIEAGKKVLAYIASVNFQFHRLRFTNEWGTVKRIWQQ